MKPSNELITAAKAVFMAKALVETLRPKIQKIQQDLLTDLDIHCDPQYADNERQAGPLTPERAWLMSDEDAEIYYGLLDKDYRAAGFTYIEKGQCPLLLAENHLRLAERVFAEASLELTAKAGFTEETIEKIVTCAYPNGLERRREYIDLTLRFVAPFVDATL